ncbi:MAG: aminotransferase class I/II-fold pyridoxal phosphate-dependent enzyme, partial [Burkholderiales bacterium]|nr:aminotransferase class I/II-fold pyridoxal phosphate-dependent enzyme [Burkholderiales bacterium]
EVLMPDPCYPCNRHFVAAFEGVARLVECGPEVGFQLTNELVQKHWTADSKGVLLASPSNPTGTSIPRAELAKIIATVKEKQGFTIVDEIYQGLSYDDEAFSALSLDEDVLVINSFSKFFNMTGWRLGWLVVPERIVPQIEKLAQNLFICPSTVAQYAALACFSDDAMKIYQQRKAEFKRRRDFIVPALRKLGFKVPVTPDGAFYVYADCSGFSDNADLFTRDLLQKAGVVIVPGLDFGPYTARKYVRISYATSMENLQEAVLRIENYLRQQ